MKRYEIDLTILDIAHVMGAMNEIIKDLKKEKQTKKTKKLINYYERLIKNIELQLQIELLFEEVEKYEKKRNTNY